MKEPASYLTNTFLNDIERAKSSQAHLLVDHSAIRHNLEQIRENCRHARIMAVLKGNAYGAGTREILSIIAPFVQAYAVDNLAEAIELRQLGVQENILVFEGGIRECIDLAVRYRLTPGISDTEQLEAYNELANKQNARLPIWLLTNVGFNRSGYREQDAFSGFVKRASACPKLYIDAVYAHM